MPLSGTGGRHRSRVLPSTRGSTCPREATRCAPCLPRHRDSGIAVGCEIDEYPEHGPAPARARSLGPRGTHPPWEQEPDPGRPVRRRQALRPSPDVAARTRRALGFRAGSMRPGTSSSSHARAACQAKTRGVAGPLALGSGSRTLVKNGSRRCKLALVSETLPRPWP
jgi:hypothetical protein